jgi:L-threonylcarbamoyladenylate synthase
MSWFSACKLRHAVSQLKQGGLIAYPTEAVYGLGCDPLNQQAVLKILQLKQRPIEKGLILVAADFAQLAPFLDYDEAILARVLPTWPGAVTWVIPAQTWVPTELTGQHTSLAVRVTAHPLVRQLCQQANMPLVSSSANPNTRLPARSSLRVRQYFTQEISDLLILAGTTGGYQHTSRIYDARSGVCLR